MYYNIILFLFSYLMGSIATGYFLGKIFLNIDIRKYGSGNVGATNSARVLGYKYGIIVLVVDVLKGAIPTYIGYQTNNIQVAILCAFFSIIGHTYSVFLNFNGGKAVATTVGVFLVISPYSILTLLFSFTFITITTGYVSVASMVSASLLPICVYFYSGNKYEILFAIIIAILIIYRHRSNIKNLINNKEAKFFDKADKNKE